MTGGGRLPLLLGALALSVAPQAVYDREFQGYVPIVGGIERPDLAARDGRLPESPRLAVKRAKRALAPFSIGRFFERLFHRPPARHDRPRRRWLARRAVITLLEVRDGAGQPIAGARVYRFHDPSFYAVNDDERGARLSGAHRYLPYPFPASLALSLVAANEEVWLDTAFAGVAAPGPDIDDALNPWRRDLRPAPSAPIEFVGSTDASGHLTAIDGLFNLRDRERFPYALVPSSIRIGYIVMAPGYLPGFSERRLEGGGLRETRRLTLLPGRWHGLLGSVAFRAAAQLADEMPMPPNPTGAWFETAAGRLEAMLGTAAARIEAGERERALAEARARLLGRLARRVPPEGRVAPARLAARLTPGSGARRYRLAAALAERAGIGRHLLPEGVTDPTALLAEAEREARAAIDAAPGLLDAAALLDRLLVRRGAGEAARRALARRVLALLPFDRWARSRLAILDLRAGRDAEAYDHLRYTPMMTPGLAGDRELAAALSNRFWRLGLPEKGGFFSYLYSGQAPEAPATKTAAP